MAGGAEPSGFGWVVLILAALGGLTGLVSLLTVRANRRKLTADAAAVLNSATVAMLAPLEKRITRLNAEMEAATGLMERMAAVIDRWYQLIHTDGIDLLTVRERIRTDEEYRRIRHRSNGRH